MSNSPSHSLASVLAAQFQRLQDQIESLDTEAIARRSGFLHRAPRKIPIPKLVLGLVALAAELTLSLERIAAVIGLASGCSYSKQALSKRITAHVEDFLAQVAVALFGRLSQGMCPQGLFGAFRRVLLPIALTGIDPDMLRKSDPLVGSRSGGFFLPRSREFFRVVAAVPMRRGGEG